MDEVNLFQNDPHAIVYQSPLVSMPHKKGTRQDVPNV